VVGHECSGISDQPGPKVRGTQEHHVPRSVLQRAVKEATRKTGMAKAVSYHTLRFSFAMNLLEGGYDIHAVQELLGHRDVKTTMIYTHVLNRGGQGVYSPVDRL
jgi:site-specific recombinase XerD